jgi:cytochrome c-type biogenesis protein CcmH/NrfG
VKANTWIVGLVVLAVVSMRASRTVAQTEAPNGHERVSESDSDRATLPAQSSAAEREITRWTEAAKQQPDDVMAWVNLGNALMQRSREGTGADEDYDAAESAFRQALKIAPHHAEATVGLAWVCNSRHQFDQGIEWARKAIQLDAANQDAYALLGDAVVELGNYEQALEHYQKCRIWAPTWPRIAEPPICCSLPVIQAKRSG